MAHRNSLLKINLNDNYRLIYVLHTTLQLNTKITQKNSTFSTKETTDKLFLDKD